MFKKSYVMVCFLLLILPISDCLGIDEGNWVNITKGISGRILCVSCVIGENRVYAGTTEGLYVLSRPQDGWSKINVLAGMSSITDIAVVNKKIFLVVDNKIYIGKTVDRQKNKIEWKPLVGISGINGITASSVLLLWSDKELFRFAEESLLEEISPKFLGSSIDEVICVEYDGKDILYAASGGNIFRSYDFGRFWEKIYAASQFKEDEYIDNGEEEREESTGTVSAINDIDSFESQGCVATAPKGVFVVSDRQVDMVRIPSVGLLPSQIKYVVSFGKDIFSATSKGIFYYSVDDAIWNPFYEETFSDDISLMEKHIDEKGHRWLWIAAGRHIYRKSVELSHMEKGNSMVRLDNAVSIREVHNMAIEYAEVSPEKIKKWRNAARWKAIMPKLSFGISESADDNVEIYKSASTTYTVTGPREIDNDWDIDLTWDLSDLVWNDVQTNIDIRSKLMVQLRDEILEEVTRLYFERKRLLRDIVQLNKMRNINEGQIAEPEIEIFEKQLRVEEVTAYIDALTGGKFSRALKLGG